MTTRAFQAELAGRSVKGGAGRARLLEAKAA
jgi:hypothetical protein